jgi:hypothetical protein
LEGCVDAFSNAIQHLNNGPLRYNWIRYLPSKSPNGTFFDDFTTLLFERLSTARVLEDSTEMLLVPSGVGYTPPPYQDDNGYPLIAMAELGGNDLSPKYEARDLEQLKALGVSCLDDAKFLSHLDLFLQRRSDRFRGNLPVWHKRLAEILTPLVQTQYITILQSLDLIPISDGTWIRAKEGQFFFNTAGDGWQVPQGLNLKIVDEVAAAEPTRSRLYTLLGAIQLDTSQLWSRIIQLHDGAVQMGLEITRSALVSQIGFLFVSGWKNMQEHRFWFETTAESRVLGPVLYRESPQPYSASHFFGEQHQSKFVHADYTSAFPHREEEWLEWLRVNFGIEVIPRVVSKTSDDLFNIHPDMEYLIDSTDYLDVLLFLRQYWDTVARWVVPGDAEDRFSDSEHSRRQVRERIGRMKVRCHGEKIVELSRTALSPSQDLTAENNFQYVLDIPDNEDPRWQLLRHFGAGEKRSLRKYVGYLQDLVNIETSLEQVLYILEQIENMHSQDEILVR